MKILVWIWNLSKKLQNETSTCGTGFALVKGRILFLQDPLLTLEPKLKKQLTATSWILTGIGEWKHNEHKKYIYILHFKSSRQNSRWGWNSQPQHFPQSYRFINTTWNWQCQTEEYPPLLTWSSSGHKEPSCSLSPWLSSPCEVCSREQCPCSPRKPCWGTASWRGLALCQKRNQMRPLGQVGPVQQLPCESPAR